jgi:hypothetical protein
MGNITGFLVIVAFMTSAATFSAFLFFAIGEAATRADDGAYAPPSYQPMEMLTSHPAPPTDAPTATPTVHVPVAA